MSMSMNNRLLQNYLDLSLNSEAKNSDVCSPKPSGNDKKKQKLAKLAKATAAANQLAQSSNNEALKTTDINSNESTIGDFEFSGKNLLNNDQLKNSQQNSDLQRSAENLPNGESIEMNNLEQSETSSSAMSSSSSMSTTNEMSRPLGGKKHQPQSSANFNSISGLITGIEQKFMHMRAENTTGLLSQQNSHKIEHAYNNPSLNPMETSTYEISRIPSVKRPIYSVSTVATQADMDRGTILAERKDFKYRNQDMSDVESQILSIEVDLCSDAYASIADWCHNSSGATSKPMSSNNSNYHSNYHHHHHNHHNQFGNGSIKDRYLSARKELASVTVNDYVAFKNCLNMQLQTTTTTTSNETNTLKPVNLIPEINDGVQQSAPIRNRMIVRIASISSGKSSTDNNKQLAIESAAIKDDSPTTTTAIYPLSKNSEVTEADIERKLSKLILEAYQSAILANNSNRSSQDSTSIIQSFPNNLYMCIGGGDKGESATSKPAATKPDNNNVNFLTTKDCIENLIRLNIRKLVNDPPPPPPPENQPPAILQSPPPPLPALKQSSTINTILDANESSQMSQTSSRLEESFMKCYEVNAKLKETRQLFRLKYQPDPNEIYSHVETSSGSESGGGGGGTKLSRSDSNSSSSGESTNSSSSATSTTTSSSSATSTTTTTSSSSTSTVGSIEMKTDQWHHPSKSVSETSQKNSGSYSLEQAETKQQQPPQQQQTPAMSKAERLKKMLEEERAMLELARKKTTNDPNPSNPPKCSYTNKVYADDEQIDSSTAPQTTTTSTSNKSQPDKQHFRFKDEDFSEDYNYPHPHKNMLIHEDDDDDDDFSSSATGSKNVRFADDVSYI